MEPSAWLCFMLSLALGIAFAHCLEYFDDTFIPLMKSSVLHLPALAVIPAVGETPGVVSSGQVKHFRNATAMETGTAESTLSF